MILRKWFAAAVLLGICAALLLLLWRHWFGVDLDRFVKKASARQYNILLITIDTLRADRLHCYGFQDINTPNIDGLAENGVLFADATAHVPLTLPSHTAIMTGNFPSYHGVHDNGGFHVAKSQITMAELFKQNGFATGAVVGAFVLDSTWGLNQGFESYFDHFDVSKEERVNLGSIQRNAEDVYKHATNWLDHHKNQRFFLWTHFYDPHTPYEPPEEFAKLYPNRPYVAEIAHTDFVVGKLLAYLDKNQLREKTVILLTGDHGESLGEHDESTHAFFVYDATLHVPMILSVPQTDLARKRIVQQVRSIDVMPTLLQLAGITVPESVQGRSLLHLTLDAATIERRPSYAECYYPQYHFGWSRLLSLRDGRYKYIDTSKPELYDLTADPHEIHNVYGQHQDIASEMKSELARIAANQSRDALMAPGEVDDDTHEKLAALGYVGAFAGPKNSDPAKLPDPKDKIGLFNRITSARMDSLDGNSDGAIAKFKEILRLDPGIVDAQFMLGNEYFKLERYPEALEAFKKALELKPDYEFAMINLANTYRRLGKTDEAIAGFEYFLKKNPANTQALARMGELYLSKQEPDKALEYLERALNETPDTSWVQNSIGVAYYQKKKYAEAEASFRKALQLNPKINEAHFNLAQLFELQKKIPDAEKEYLAELEAAPKNIKAAFNLGRIYVSEGEMGKGIVQLESVVKNAPEFSLGYLFLAQAYLEAGSDLNRTEQLARTALSMKVDSEYKPLGHYILADVYNRQGKKDLEMQELRLAKQ